MLTPTNCRWRFDAVRWSRDGLQVPVTVFEAATLHKAVQAVCACKHTGSLELVAESDADVSFALPDPRVWKRALSRVR